MCKMHHERSKRTLYAFNVPAFFEDSLCMTQMNTRLFPSLPYTPNGRLFIEFERVGVAVKEVEQADDSCQFDNLTIVEMCL